MSNVLIVNKEQYGYHIDTYKYCFYLSEDYNITYLSWNDGKKKIVTSGINCIYLERKGNILNRYLILLQAILKEIRNKKYDVIFVLYFFGCSFLRLFSLGSVFNLDIRTLAVTNNGNVNFLLDKLLFFESLFFKNITVISDETGKQLKIKNFYVLPLGGESLGKSKKPSKNLNLIYVGTLSNRNIMDLVNGFKTFILKYPVKRETTLTLIGDGYGNELEMLKEFIKINDLEYLIFTTGYVQNDDLGYYFDNATCGVSFIPITPYYQNQPPTKTYEYLLSGLPVLATNTNANAKIIHDSNGILIEDNIDAVAKGIFDISEKLSSYSSGKIKNEMHGSLWENIVKDIFQPYLASIIQKKKEKK